MKILITGGAGFIGTNFTYYYFDKHPEAEIVILDKLTYAGTRENLDPLSDDPRFKFEQIDIIDKDAVFALFARERF
ncbi:dTDP-glucose 4,6-dehydratase, partial [Candidatus Peregrinibacteria bacterium CG_4_9_14_0_8_um_filter_44_15]